MRNNPRWLIVHYPASCQKCRTGIPKGSTGFWYPLSRAMYCPTCGKVVSADFDAATQDEMHWNNA